MRAGLSGSGTEGAGTVHIHDKAGTLIFGIANPLSFYRWVKWRARDRDAALVIVMLAHIELLATLGAVCLHSYLHGFWEQYAKKIPHEDSLDKFTPTS